MLLCCVCPRIPSAALAQLRITESASSPHLARYATRTSSHHVGKGSLLFQCCSRAAHRPHREKPTDTGVKLCRWSQGHIEGSPKTVGFPRGSPLKDPNKREPSLKKGPPKKIVAHTWPFAPQISFAHQFLSEPRAQCPKTSGRRSNVSPRRRPASRVKLSSRERSVEVPSACRSES